MSGLFDRLQSKHTPPKHMPQQLGEAELPEPVKPNPILAKNGIRNLITREDGRPRGLRELVASMVGRDLGDSVSFTQSIRGRTYLFFDEDDSIIELQSYGQEWVLTKKGKAGPRTDEIPEEASGLQVTWFSNFDERVRSMQQQLCRFLEEYYDQPSDFRFLSRQIEWGHGINRYHWDSNLGQLHMHMLKIDDRREAVAQIDALPLYLHFHSTPDHTGWKLVDQPDSLPF